MKDGAAYTLTLSNSGTEPVTSWRIDWGDGTAVQDVSGSASSVTHNYPLGLQSYTITATASSATRSDVSAGGLALDPSFGAGGKVAVDVTADADYGYAMAVQPDGKIVMAGWVGSDFGLIRLHPDGSRDMTFDDGAPAGDGLVRIEHGTSSDRAYAIVLDPSSPDRANPRIVVAGSSGGDFALVRLNPSGTLDTSFGDFIRGTTTRTGKKRIDFGGTDEAHAVAIGNDNNIVAAGYTTNGAVAYMSDGEPYATRDFAVVRVDPNGDLDPDFDGDGRATVNFLEGSHDYAQSVAVDGSWNVVLGGYTDGGCTVDGAVSSYDFALARLTYGGALDTGFDGDGLVRTDFDPDYCSETPNPADSDYSLLIQEADGKILTAGVTGRDTLDSDFALVRYNTDGSRDTTFGTEGTGWVRTGFRSTTDDGAYAVKLQLDGKIVAAGYSRGPSTTETRQDFALIRYQSDGTLDPTFGTAGKVWTDFGGVDSDDRIKAVDVDPRGRVIAAGHAGNTFAAARYLSDNRVSVVAPIDPLADDIGEVHATAVSTSQIDLKWEGHELSNARYNVYRSTEEDFAPDTTNLRAGNVAANLFSDTSVLASTRYFYRVTMVTAGGESVASEQATQITAFNTQPATAWARSSDEYAATLMWTDDSANESGFVIEQLVGDVWTFVENVGPDETSTFLYGLTPDTLYTFEVRATFGGIQPAQSPSVRRTTTVRTRRPAETRGLVMLVHGHKHTRSTSARASAIRDISERLEALGYRTWEAVEFDRSSQKDLNWDGSGRFYSEVLGRLQAGGIRDVAMIGYSHGASVGMRLVNRLGRVHDHEADPWRVTYTAYIDGIGRGPVDDFYPAPPERNRPEFCGCFPTFHDHYYQRSGFNILKNQLMGDSTFGGDDQFTQNHRLDGPTHYSINQHEAMKSEIIDEVIRRVAF